MKDVVPAVVNCLAVPSKKKDQVKSKIVSSLIDMTGLLTLFIDLFQLVGIVWEYQLVLQ